MYSFTSVWTETLLLFSKIPVNICPFRFWNDDANFNVTFLFPSWQISLFCFSVLNFFLMPPTFPTHGQFKKLWLFPFFNSCSFWLKKKIGRRESLAFSKVYFTVLKLATCFSRDNSFIHSTQSCYLDLSWIGLDARDALMNNIKTLFPKSWRISRKRDRETGSSNTPWPKVNLWYYESTAEGHLTQTQGVRKGFPQKWRLAGTCTLNELAQWILAFFLNLFVEGCKIQLYNAMNISYESFLLEKTVTISNVL